MVGMLAMLIMTVLQRGLGFGRGVLFCRLMSDVDVGSLSMAYDFIVMFTPIAMLGIPGSLARYVETYRRENRAGQLVRRLAMITGALGITLVLGLLLARRSFAYWIFLSADRVDLVVTIAAGVAAIVAFNFTYELLASLRQVRAASWMQFIQSVGFSILGVVWLLLGGGLVGLLSVFAAVTIFAMVPASIILKRGWHDLDNACSPASNDSIWRRVLPYAGALWMMNLLTNAFTMSDRYLILHAMPGGDETVRAAIGQYHSARLIPLLLTSLAAMVSGVLLPYLSADWESSRREQVVATLKRALVGVSVLFTIGGGITLTFAPWLFESFLENRYSQGLALMPMAMAMCIYAALAIVGQDYLWVAEKGKWVAVATGIGLSINIALTLLWLPSMGLSGAVLATLIANQMVLCVLWAIMHAAGFRIDLSIIVISILPATLLAGGPVATACGVIAAYVLPQAGEAVVQFGNHPKISPLLRRRL